MSNRCIQDSRFTAGLTLLELMLAIALLAIIAAMLFPFFGNFRRTKELDETAKEIVFLLRRAQSFSQNNVGSKEWGVRFENPTSSTSFFALYSYSPTTSEEVRYLPESLDFTDPADGAPARDIIFTKGNGRNKSGASETITIALKTGTENKKISITKEGKIDIGAIIIIPQTVWGNPVGAQASTVYSPGYVATNAIDDNSGTYWISVSVPPQWLCVDMGALKYVDGIRIRIYDNITYDPITFDLQISDTSCAAGFTSILANQTVTTPSGTTYNEFPFTPFTARYIKFYITSQGTNVYALITDVQVKAGSP